MLISSKRIIVIIIFPAAMLDIHALDKFNLAAEDSSFP
jgi:hypothetical protein